MNTERLRNRSELEWNAYVWTQDSLLSMWWWRWWWRWWSTFTWEKFRRNFMVNTEHWWYFSALSLVARQQFFICKFLISDDEVTWMIRYCYCYLVEYAKGASLRHAIHKTITILPYFFFNSNFIHINFNGDNSTANGSKLVSNYLIKEKHICVLSSTRSQNAIFKSANVIDAANRVQQTVYHGVPTH